ncbi:hypothetical protein BZL29_5804 [Mycobacterium kansasii]|uniref:Uncharacterized protein n=1 Tax=Mycobacterium kansasii TaxID=1768 RepID=A0A1V3WWS9_MYCKA|nr:hypothetical protein BZL29_5804 [Mycobacterium kansasii]
MARDAGHRPGADSMGSDAIGAWRECCRSGRQPRRSPGKADDGPLP